jgi:threonine aldolase
MTADLNPLDFRSDTFTQPGPGMRRAMAAAAVGDDVFGEDPTVTALEQRVAALFGRQAALFVPSGTMANLIGLALHCGRGDEVILERRTHSFAHEVGGGAALLGILFQVLDSPGGYLLPEQVAAAIRQRDVHQPISRLVVVENTANISGGKVMPLESLRAMRRLCSERGLRLHLDGARIWHAAVATGVGLDIWAAEVDSLSCCLSKGLGCPVGSLVIADRDAIDRARWQRKMLGGGMRQAGVLAACGLYALEHNLPALERDHRLAAELGAGLARLLPEGFVVEPPETNMVLVRAPDARQAAATLARFNDLGVRCLPVGDTTIRLVAHRDLPDDAAAAALARIGRDLKTREPGSRRPAV